MQKEELKICLAQYDIAWEDKPTNIAYIEKVVAKVARDADLVILPEMCATAWTFDVDPMAEPADGAIVTTITTLAKEYNIAICGSFLCIENEKYYNRGFFITPTECHFYDKRHLFRMGKEADVFTAGNKKTIVDYKGFNIALFVCYDLRFPVWSRNIDNEYDVMIYVANWPESRKDVWNTLLVSRAIENMSYVCGVNRIGKDDNDLDHAGQSVVLNPRGQKIGEVPKNKKGNTIVTINKELLIRDRTHFPVWKDADKFDINI